MGTLSCHDADLSVKLQGFWEVWSLKPFKRVSLCLSVSPHPHSWHSVSYATYGNMGPSQGGALDKLASKQSVVAFYRQGTLGVQ